MTLRLKYPALLSTLSEAFSIVEGVDHVYSFFELLLRLFPEVRCNNVLGVINQGKVSEASPPYSYDFTPDELPSF